MRVVLFDYRKASDFIDHNLLVRKVFGLSIPRCVAWWVADFLIDRQQRVKLSRDCFSEWGPVPAGVPQGTRLGPWLFILMIKDLRVSGFHSWKYVDDTTVAEIVSRGESSDIQSAVHAVETWSCDNHMTLNADKCKPVIVDGKELSVVSSAKTLGVTLSSDLAWNDHVNEAIRKANKRLCFLVLLKREEVNPHGIIKFYCTVVRPLQNAQFGSKIENAKNMPKKSLLQY